MNFLINSHRFLVSGGNVVGFQPETIAWISRVVNSGNTVNNTAKNATNAFVVACKNAGIWDKFRRVNLFCGDSFAAMLHPLVNIAGFPQENPRAFVTPIYSQASGLKGASSLELNTGLVPEQHLAWNNWHCGIYYTAVIPNGAGMDLGCYGTSSHPVNEAHIQFRFTSHYNQNVGGLVIAGDFHAGGNPTFQLQPPSIMSGLMLMSRQNASSLRVRNTSGSVYKHFEQHYQGIQALPTAPVHLLSDARSLYSPNTLAGYSLGTALTETEMAAFASIMETFQTALGRNRG